MDWNDLRDQTRGTSSRSQKGQEGKLYCTSDSEATMLDREQSLGLGWIWVLKGDVGDASYLMRILTLTETYTTASFKVRSNHIVKLIILNNIVLLWACIWYHRPRGKSAQRHVYEVTSKCPFFFGVAHLQQWLHKLLNWSAKVFLVCT